MASRVALVTGSASGIGRASAQRLHDDGFTVVGLDRNPDEQSPWVSQVYDLTDLDGLEEFVDKVEADVGPIDVLVNNAAIWWPTPVDDLSLADLRRMIDVNLLAGTMLAVLAGRGMKARQWGRIVWISSVKDLLGEPTALPYDVAKGGVSQATRTLAAELGPHGVLVNAVAPGFVRTDLSVIDGVNELDTDAFKTLYVDSGRIPLGRAAQPHEIAACVAWLVGEECSYVNGAVLRADGGLSGRL